MIKIKLTIPEPCHEDWAKMTPTEKGKFCGSCEKEVFDMTQSSEEEVADKMSKSKSGEVCARVPVDYLEKPIQLYAAGIGNYGKLSTVGALITAVAFTPMISGSFTSDENSTDKNHIVIKNPVSVQVNGTVTNDKDELLSGAKVAIIQNGNKATAFTMANGRFVFNLDPQKINSGTAFLKIEKEGFDNFEKEITITDSFQNGRFVLKETVEITDISDCVTMVSGNISIEKQAVITDLEPVVIRETITDIHHYVLGGAVAYIAYEKEEVIPVYTSDTLKEEKFVFEETKIIPNEIKTYPNPAADVVTVEMKYEGKYSLYIFDLTGKMVQQQNFNSNKITIDLSSNERGTYIIKVVDADKNENFDSKIVLMR